MFAAAAGFCLSYPWHYNFWGGLINSGFGAAMIGGLADWYAVTALFRKPLNISYRTAIIPRNRERIFQAIVKMVEEEIVTAATIKETLAEAGLARMLLNHAAQPDARQRLYVLAEGVMRDAMCGLGPDRVAAALDLLLKEHRDKVRIAPLAGQALEWSVAHGFIDKLVDGILDEIKYLVKEPYMEKLISDIYESALKAYAAKQNQRKLVGWLLESLLNLDPVTVAGIIQEKIVIFLTEIQESDHPVRLRLLDLVSEGAASLQGDTALAEKAESEFKPLMAKLVESLAELPADHPEFVAGGAKWTVKQAVRFVGEVTEDAARRERLDTYLAAWLADWVNKNQGEIGQIVTTYLEGFSNEELVAYIEGKVMNDLQMIRINGSIVGGLVGMVLFVLAQAAGVSP
ncbi:hypothetical protein SATMO3_58610 [Sporomusa aerivorans]